VDLSGLEIEVVGQKVGEVSVYVNPRDIILSKTLLESSARNVFRGRIVEISDLGDTVKLTVDVGKEFSVLITQRSFKDMWLSLSEEVYIGFKASSVQVL
jgi:molybdate/tungstate transport system ATP-binding protein